MKISFSIRISPNRELAGACSYRNAATSQHLQDRVIVESEPFSNGGAGEPLSVELGCDGDLGVGHPARCVNTVFTDDAGDCRAGHAELSSDGSHVADSEVSGNDEFDFVHSQLPSSLGGCRGGILPLLRCRSEQQLLR